MRPQCIGKSILFDRIYVGDVLNHRPLHDCLMIEPTESEDKGELDRYCDSLLAIRQEIDQIAAGQLDISLFKVSTHPTKPISPYFKISFLLECSTHAGSFDGVQMG